MDEMISNAEAKQLRLKNLAGIKVSDRVYNLIIGATLVWGILIDVLMAAFLLNQIVKLNPIVVMIIYIVGSLACTFVVYKSNNPVVSFLGFTGLAISMGLILCFFVSTYELGTISLAFQLTAIITVAMMILATVFPGFFLSIGRGLGIALLVTIIVELFAGFILRMNLVVTDYIIVAIFCGYIGVDWARSQIYPKSVDNAIDCAADIYVDVINIFIRLLVILGKKKN